MSLESWRELPRRKLDDPVAMRAFAHPVRLALHELLMRSGATTAADAAREVGISQALASYHLRQLARYGFVEQAEARDERERPWRATTLSQEWSNTESDPEFSAARGLLEQVIIERALAQLAEWRERRAQEPEEWRGYGGVGNSYLYVTPDELTELENAIGRLMEPLMARITDPSERPEGARPVLSAHLLVPLPVTGTGD
ncbi:helix-turn-helix domain-containing protein [Nonomuraea sp. NPDC050404]|uniref:ArsR/SmtB family transcription factor n=1 Tax=Nonomuraea sp. NPDC050404 TaxID=3155783 RepID=UPI0033D9E635